MCAITAIPLEKSKVLFGLEELEEFSVVDETDAQATGGDLGRMAFLEKWGWIMFECGIENLTVKGGTPAALDSHINTGETRASLLLSAGGRQSGAVLYNAFGVMGHSDTGGPPGTSKFNGSSGSQTGSGYSTDMSDDNLPPDAISPVSDANEHSDDSDEQVECSCCRELRTLVNQGIGVQWLISSPHLPLCLTPKDEGVESDDLKRDLPLMPPPPDSSSMKLTIRQIWFSFAAPTNVRSPSQAISRY